MGSLFFSVMGENPLSSTLCSSCFRILSTGAPKSQIISPWRSPRLKQVASPRYQHTQVDKKNESGGGTVKQIYPLKGYYSDILTAPSQPYNPSRRPQPQTTEPSSTTASGTAQTEPSTEKLPQEKFGIVFGTRLAGPGYSSTRYNPATTPPKSTWHTINGVPIPPRPEEPDNCCMSGCVHCVWDDYRDDVEAWAQRINEAKKRDPPRRGAKKKKAAGPLHDMRQAPRKEVDSASASMDDDGGGSQASWNTDTSADALFADIPVGIREFMKTEKRLKEKRKRVEDRS
ncbi:uncharacterized protein GIQ15_06102 [Arthroderma uncinatum]|uniref:uncharacterized protein n=1 Tax=Arthroderma uncinatum TaxID=74035 RepID=UPI00144AF3BB|nr:uncharacterized protein GIQ15_06102 [Arthroderma uncinatum]KAF3480755.1 hypothetical protein GIQ15_06102 [Arthroderma uncinatum]